MDISGLPLSDNISDYRQPPKSAWEAMSRNREDRMKFLKEFTTDTTNNFKDLGKDVLERLGISKPDTYEGVWGKPIDYSELQSQLANEGFKNTDIAGQKGQYDPSQFPGNDAFGAGYETMTQQPVNQYEGGAPIAENSYEGVW